MYRSSNHTYDFNILYSLHRQLALYLSVTHWLPTKYSAYFEHSELRRLSSFIVHLAILECQTINWIAYRSLCGSYGNRDLFLYNLQIVRIHVLCFWRSFIKTHHFRILVAFSSTLLFHLSISKCLLHCDYRIIHRTFWCVTVIKTDGTNQQKPY